VEGVIAEDRYLGAAAISPLLDLRGIITVLNTPFTRDDAIDVDGLKENVRRAIKGGVIGFLVPAMASEVEKLSEAERDLMVKSVVETARGSAAVIGGASAPTSGARVRHALRCVELGCDGVLASIPFLDESQYERDVRSLAELNPPFLMLQDWDAIGSGVPVHVIARLFSEIDVFRCLKIEVVPAGIKYSEVREATNSQLHLSGGWAVMQMIEALDRGVHAFMPTGMHEIYCQIYSLYSDGKRREAQTLCNRLLPVLAFSNQHLDISIHFFKRLLHRQGIYATPRVREPILPFDSHHQRIADDLIDDVIELTKEIG